MLEEVRNGTTREIDGKPCIYYDGYWIRYYVPPPESLTARKRLIDNLKKRLFHHTEPGINTPGEKLEAAREAFENEHDPARKRVNGAMLAGALFNRATDIFTAVVELEARGVKISPENELMRQCGECFQEALELGKSVRHYSGHEGIDELWGEPFKAFAQPLPDFYHSRYVKLAQTMRDIDRIVDKMASVFELDPAFEAVVEPIRSFGEIAKLETETMRSDPATFTIWPRFVSTAETVIAFVPQLDPSANGTARKRAQEGLRVLREGKALLTYLSGVRAPMPKSTAEYLARCDEYRREHALPEFQPG